MKTYRFYKTDEYYFMVERIAHGWKCVLSDNTSVRVGGCFSTQLITVERWMTNRGAGNFAMEFKAESLEDAKEKVFLEML